MCIEQCGSLGLSRCSHELAAERELANVSAIDSMAHRSSEPSTGYQADGKWQRNGRRLVLASAMLTGSIGLVGASQAAAAPCADTDGDGWGWDGSATCIPDDGGDAGYGSSDSYSDAGYGSSGSESDASDSDRSDNEVGDSDRDEFDSGSNDDDPPGISVFGLSLDDNFGPSDASFDYSGGHEDSPAPEAPCVDSEPLNDGWGWNGTESCELPIEAGRCVDTTPFGNGWGWNGVESCRLMETSTPEDDDYIHRDPDSQGISGCWDTDGDGYGIDYDGASCVVPTATPPGFSDLVSSPDVVEQLSEHLWTEIKCVDSDGDGWGWDGERSCEMYNTEEVDISLTPTTDSYEERCQAEFGDVMNGSCVVCADPYIYDLFSPWEGPDGDSYVDNRAMECREILV